MDLALTMDALGDRVLSPRIALTDEELMIRYEGGDRSALELLVRRHEAAVYNFVLRQLRSEPVAERVVQDAFVLVVQSVASSRDEVRFATSLYSAARDMCIQHLRKRAVRHGRLLDGGKAPRGEEHAFGSMRAVGTAAEDGKGEPAPASVPTEERVRAAVDALPEDQREIFLMREVANLPFRQIADVVRAPEDTVKNRMRAALERLQAALSDFDEYARALR